MTNPPVLVIGAGPAGIASAVALQERNVPYIVYDRAQTVGDTWHSLYPSLRLNTTRFYSHLPAMRFPLRYGIFPTGAQYHEYLLRYVEKCRLNIQLGVDVRRVSPENGGWRVESSRGVEHFKAVICATGIYGNPITPQFDGLDTFTGQHYHAHAFRHPHQVTNQRVLVVGNGPSGVDIAVASSQTAQSVHLAIRSGISMVRRYPYGLPKHGWMMLGALLPKAWCNRLMRLTNVPYTDAPRYGLVPSAQGSLTAYQGRELLDAVKRGHVTPVKAPTRFDGDTVHLADGTHLTPDVVIFATGYEPVMHRYCDFPMQFSDSYWDAPAPCEWAIGPNGQRGFPLLDRSTHPNGREIVGQRGIYVVGVYYKGKGAMYNMTVEARIASEQITNYLQSTSIFAVP